MTAAEDQLIGMAGSIWVHADDIPWIWTGPAKNYELRILHARPDDNLVVSQFRALPGAMSALHRHPVHTCVITHAGSWGHEPDNYEFVANTYTFEIPGVVHRFYAGPGGAFATSIGTGGTEVYDAEGRNIISVSNAHTAVEAYFKGCDEAGIPRPAIIR